MSPCPDGIRIFDFFKAGRHVAMNGSELEFGEAELDRICRNYLFQTPAPLVVGHPASNGPSYGTVREIFRKNGSLYAVATCGQALIDFVRDGRFKNRSASFATKGDLPGYSLRHIGFLGAVPPSVKGLSALQFSEPQDEVPGVVSFSDDEPINTTFLDTYSGCSTASGYCVDSKSIPLYRLACKVHAGCPDLSFAEAASIAERHI